MASSSVPNGRPTDRILPETRVVASLVIIILLAASMVLYFFPDYGAEHFAWPIRPRLSAMLIGSGYLGGAYFFWRVLTGAQWHRVSQGFWPITVFTVFMLAATLLHIDRFRHGQLEFYVWTAVYIITPVLVPFIWWRQHGVASISDSGEQAFSNATRLGLILAGGAGLILSCVIFYDPQWFVARFPWQSTPLTARVAAGWYALCSCTLLSISANPRWSAADILIQSGLIGLLFFLVAIFRGWTEFDFGNPLAWIFIAAVASLTVFLAECERRGKARTRRAS
jgi:hypothetical protein